MVGAMAGMAKALLDKTRQKKKPRLTRALTVEELQPLEDHVIKSYTTEDTNKTGDDRTYLRVRQPRAIITAAKFVITVFCKDLQFLSDS
jgi:hypothetical protein